MTLAEIDGLSSAQQAWKKIDRKVRQAQNAWDRMDADYALYTLEQWQPDPTESISPEDAYTTNEPRVLAEKIIAFISATEVVIRSPNDEAQEAQEEVNKAAEQLAIGMWNNVNRRMRRSGEPPVHDALSFYTVVRGRYAAARAFLRKRENGDTYEDILPLDPRHLIVERGDEELAWAAYRMRWTVSQVRENFPTLEFTEPHDEDDSIDVWEYYERIPNPDYDPVSSVPFDRHPWVYQMGTLVDQQWAKAPHNMFMLSFPVVLAPVTSQPRLARTEKDDRPDEHFGESVFAENRFVWDKLNRATSYVLDLTGKATDPQKKVFSLDGTKTLDEGANDKGAEVNLSTANQEELELAQQPDINNSAAVLLQRLQQDAVAGGLPPQAFGLLDKPLSSVALRQLGNNLEHRVLPRLRAVASCIEGCIENLISQYETGAFEPISVSGRRFDNQRFANRVIEPQMIFGHDPIEISMDLALPEDEVSRWTVAQMSQQPTSSGQPLVSLEWAQEHILKIQSPKTMQRQNLELAGRMQDPLAQAMMQVEAYLRDGDKANASIWYDKLQLLWLQRQIEAATMTAQFQQIALQFGIQLNPQPPMTEASTIGSASTLQGTAGATPTNGNRQALNPANGAVPFAQAAGVGNQPSPQAGFNTTAPRQRASSGLLGPDGRPLE